MICFNSFKTFCLSCNSVAILWWLQDSQKYMGMSWWSKLQRKLKIHVIIDWLLHWVLWHFNVKSSPILVSGGFNMMYVKFLFQFYSIKVMKYWILRVCGYTVSLWFSCGSCLFVCPCPYLRHIGGLQVDTFSKSPPKAGLHAMTICTCLPKPFFVGVLDK